MKDSEGERPTSPRAIRTRLDQVFGSMPNEEVAAKINAIGGKASKEKVRRYRDPSEEGAERVAVDFVADVALAFGKDPAWLLTGDGSPDRKPADMSQRAFEEIVAVVDRYRSATAPDAGRQRMQPGEAAANLPPQQEEDPGEESKDRKAG